VTYEDIKYDVFDASKKKVGEKVCRFAQNEQGLIPRTLNKLLEARKKTRARMQESTVDREDGTELTGVIKGVYMGSIELTESELKTSRPTHNEFQCAVLDGLQNAYKVTANSLYGQMGARTSQASSWDIVNICLCS
jgi:DNA polymerase elongation subunit (family B)